ncbi:MAG: DUF1697 domain-containing protein [Ferruginibacter sp.]
MATYISILRGINVSGKNLIKMEQLRILYEQLGYFNVNTYVQSGNVVFEHKKTSTDTIAHTLSQAIQQQFGYTIPVIVLTVKALQQIIENNPFTTDTKKDPAFFHITFLASKPKSYDVRELEAKKLPDEAIACTPEAIYLYCPNGYGKTKLTNNFIEGKLQVTATTRNWKTTNELLKMTEIKK